MKNFEFSFPTHIVFGRGAEKQLGQAAQPYGPRAMLIYGSDRIKRSGLLGSLAGALEEKGIDVVELGGIQENPTLAKAEEGSRIARESGVTLLVAIGGGSVIDTAKAISIGAGNDGALWDYYAQRKKASVALPIGVVLTAAATASEANCVSVIRNEELNQKSALNEPLTCPKFALMNPELTYTVPAYQTASGAVDIFSHAFERYFHKEQRGTLRGELCAAVMRTVVDELPKALSEPNGYDARSQLMWAATVAHSDMLGKEGDFACHALSHAFTSELGLPHGVALGIIMIAWCRYMLEAEPEWLAGFAHQVWGVPATDDQNRDGAEGVILLRRFIRGAGLPSTLEEAGFVGIQGLAEKVLSGGLSHIGGNFRPLYRQDIEALLRLAK